MNETLKASLYNALATIDIAPKNVKKIIQIFDWAQGQRYRVFTNKKKKFGLLVHCICNEVVSVRDEDMNFLYNRTE